MAGNTSADAKRQWLHQALGVPLAKADGSGDPSAGDSDADDSSAAAPSKASPSAGRRPGNDTDLMDPNAPDAGDLPAPMQKDCVPELGKVAGPKEHVLCKKHGHVLDLKTKTIIAHTIAEYNAQHPVPRPMESDCKPQRGLIPKAPDNIVMCATHGHVLDLAKKQIIANSGIFYLRAHPEYVAQPKPKADAKPATPSAKPGDKPATPSAKPGDKPATPQTGGKPATPPAQPAAPAAKKDAKVGSWNEIVEKWRDLLAIGIHVSVRDRALSYGVRWQYGSQTLVPPPVVHAELSFGNEVRKGPIQILYTQGGYDFSGTVELKSDVVLIECVCTIILEGSVSDTLKQDAFIEINAESNPWEKKK